VKQQLVADYIETGLVRLEYRDFSHIGGESVRAGEAAACAADQDAYWQYNRTIYLNQETPPMNAGGYSDSRLIEMAEQIGLDVDEFESCLDDDTYRDFVEDTTDQARSLGIPSTPGFQVNGEIVEWSSYEALAAAIDAELENQ
jgi:protein-disulfide isomerase